MGHSSIPPMRIALLGAGEDAMGPGRALAPTSIPAEWGTDTAGPRGSDPFRARRRHAPPSLQRRRLWSHHGVIIQTITQRRHWPSAIPPMPAASATASAPRARVPIGSRKAPASCRPTPHPNKSRARDAWRTAGPAPARISSTAPSSAPQQAADSSAPERGSAGPRLPDNTAPQRMRLWERDREAVEDTEDRLLEVTGCRSGGISRVEHAAAVA